MDGVYGQVVVFVSLVGFISLVWLKDQLGNGGGPPWLENDQQEVDRGQQQQQPQQQQQVQQQVRAGGNDVMEAVVEEEEEEEDERVEGGAPEEPNNVLDVAETAHLEMEMRGCMDRLNQLAGEQFQPQIDSVRGRIVQLEFHRRSSEGYEMPEPEGLGAGRSQSAAEQGLAELRDEELQLEYEQRIRREMASRYVVGCVLLLWRCCRCVRRIPINVRACVHLYCV